MSQENVDLMRQMIESVNRGDEEGVAALMSPNVLCFPAQNQPESMPFRGREAYVQYARGWQQAFEHYAVEPSEYLDLGEYVVAVGRVVARGRGSGAETSVEDAWLVRFRDGMAVEYRECGTKEKALEVARVS
jgi:ketosteroid isomerase-like protein